MDLAAQEDKSFPLFPIISCYELDCCDCALFDGEDTEITKERCGRCKYTLDPGNPLYDKCPNLCIPKQSANPYWDNITELADKRRIKGFRSYGQGLEDNNADITDRISHLEEELIDALMYCELIKDSLERRNNDGSV